MRYYLFIVLLAGIIVTGCESNEENFELGVDLVKTKTEISMVDSFSIKLSTVILDSIPTSGTGTVLTGLFENEITGSTQANSYFTFDLADELTNVSDEAVFDSITIVLPHPDYVLGDSTQLQSLAVYRLTKPLELLESDYSTAYLFNNNSFPHEESPIGTIDYFPINSSESVEIKLDDDLGKEMIRLAKADAQELESEDNFSEYLKGFVLIPYDYSSKTMLGFAADSLKLNLYTHITGLETKDNLIQLNISANDNQFNQVISDRTNTDFENLTTRREELPADSTSNLCYIQGGSGVIVRLDFPSLNELFKLEDRILLKAELILKPAMPYMHNDLPETLHFYETDKVNQLGDQVTYETDDTEYAIEATLVQDDLYDENTYYTADISSFITSNLAGNYYDTNNGLLVTIPYSDLTSKADHLILSGEHSAEFQPKLNFYFLTYE